MIDWDKPLETEGGRLVTVLAKDVVTQDLHVEAPSVFVRIHNTFQRDVVTSFKMDSDPKIIGIRNVPVKLEGWVLKRVGANRINDYRVFGSEKAAQKECKSNEQVIRMEWEE